MNLQKTFSLQAVCAQFRDGRHAEAEAACREILHGASGDGEALYALGLAALNAGRHAIAAQLLDSASRTRPSAAAHFQHGNALQFSGDLDAAIASYRKALTLQADHAEAWNNLGAALQFQGRLEMAVEAYTRALALKPDFADAHNNLGGALQLQGRFGEAQRSYRGALAARPAYDAAHSSLLFSMCLDPACTAEQYLTEARAFGRSVQARARSYREWPAALALPAGEPLRVGLVSADLRANPVGYFLEGVIGHLDPARIRLHAYANTRREDALTARLKPRFAAWRVIAGLPDAQAAALIRDDGVQVLLDLSGHVVDNRLPLFAWKPAPVQASWLGYFASTGVPGMDYVLADPGSVPPEAERHFSEAVWRLPETRLCFTPPASARPLSPGPLPALRNGHLTFGCFQRLAKLNEGVLQAWAAILLALPGARLRLQMIEMLRPSMRAGLLRRLGAAGIDPARVTLLREVPRDQYLAAHAEVDLILDTFPFPGGTTTCEALWMGVPTLTLTGQTMLARQGAALLACVGLHDWIATSTEDYVARALRHARDLESLARLRAGLRSRALASPVFEAPRFAAHLQDALHGMWARRPALPPA